MLPVIKAVSAQVSEQETLTRTLTLALFNAVTIEAHTINLTTTEYIVRVSNKMSHVTYLLTNQKQQQFAHYMIS